MRPFPGLVPLAEVTLSPKQTLAPCRRGSATTSCLLCCLTPFTPALGLAFALLSVWNVPFQGFCLFFSLPSFTLVFRQLLKEAPHLKPKGLLTSPLLPHLYFTTAHQPYCTRACVCMCPWNGRWHTVQCVASTCG